MFKKKEKTEIKDSYWWLGPVGIIFVVLLIFFAMIRSAIPLRLDDLPSRARNRVKRAITGKRIAIWLGMQVSPMTRDAAVEFGIKPGLKGVVITDMDQGQGGAAGMNVGDIIVAINGAKITDFDSFLWLARQSKFSDGILLDVITNGKRRYLNVPFLFKGGPLIGPYTNHWQLGTPLKAPAFGYGTIVAFPNTPNPVPQGYGTGQSFMVCPNCGHSSPATPAGPVFCPNDGTLMVRNQ